MMGGASHAHQATSHLKPHHEFKPVKNVQLMLNVLAVHQSHLSKDIGDQVPTVLTSSVVSYRAHVLAQQKTTFILKESASQAIREFYVLSAKQAT